MPRVITLLYLNQYEKNYFITDNAGMHAECDSQHNGNEG